LDIFLLIFDDLEIDEILGDRHLSCLVFGVSLCRRGRGVVSW
jgi:hypothetical protein